MKILFASFLAMLAFSIASFSGSAEARPNDECTFNCYCSAKQLQRGCHVYYSEECTGSPDRQTCVKYPNCSCTPPSPPDDECIFNCYCSPKQLKKGCSNYTTRECTGEPERQTCMDYPNCSCSR